MRCLLFVVCCPLWFVCYLMFWCLVSACAWRSLFVVCFLFVGGSFVFVCLRYVVSYWLCGSWSSLLFGVRCSSFVVCVCCLLFGARLFVVWCLLLFVWCVLFAGLCVACCFVRRVLFVVLVSVLMCVLFVACPFCLLTVMIVFVFIGVCVMCVVVCW